MLPLASNHSTRPMQMQVCQAVAAPSAVLCRLKTSEYFHRSVILQRVSPYVRFVLSGYRLHCMMLWRNGYFSYSRFLMLPQGVSKCPGSNSHWSTAPAALSVSTKKETGNAAVKKADEILSVYKMHISCLQMCRST